MLETMWMKAMIQKEEINLKEEMNSYIKKKLKRVIAHTNKTWHFTPQYKYLLEENGDKQVKYILNVKISKTIVALMPIVDFLCITRWKKLIILKSSYFVVV